MSRISELPRRDWRTIAPPWVEPLSAALRAPGGSQTLRIGQTAGLLEASVTGGLAQQGRVGTGKTTTLALIPTVLRRRRPVYMTAGGLLRDTNTEIQNGRKHWRILPDLELLSYTALSNFPRLGKTFRDIYPEGPDCFLLDEAQNMANVTGAACAMQLQQWSEEHPDCVIVNATGSFDLEGVKSYAHLFDWSLRDRSPLPRTPHEVAVWQEVLHDGEPAKIWQVAADLGVTQASSIESIRSAVRDRLWSAPGVIIDDTPFTKVPLTVKEHLFEVGLEQEFQTLRELGQRPDGFDVLPAEVLSQSDMDAEDEEPDRAPNGSIAGTAKQYGAGFFYKLWPPAPPEWIAARRKYFRHVRREIESGLYMTEAQVRAAAITANEPAWTNWAAAQPTFTPQFHAVWLSDALLDWARDWAKDGPGVIWVEHSAVGYRLAEKLGFPYYRGLGKLVAGSGPKRITDGPRPSDRVVVASRHANYTGRNLQFQWDRCAFTQPIARPYIFEQATGRFHREGIETWAKKVHADILMRCSEDWRSRQKLLSKAKATHESFYSQKAGSVPWQQVSRPSDGWAFQ